MILEVDCGNSLIKWRMVGGDPLVEFEVGAANDEEDFIAQLKRYRGSLPAKARVVSVRSDAETYCLLDALRLHFEIPVMLAYSSRSLGGVTNGYIEPEQLGVDRWMAIVAAFIHVGSACLVLDIGTAVTSDFVRGDGMHLGGYICPGIRLMRNQLGAHTRRISYEPGARTDCNRLGRRTAEAVEHGTELMLLGFISTQVDKAQEYLGAECSVIVTGGDAALVASIIPSSIVVPDLVFRGLAVACPG